MSKFFGTRSAVALVMICAIASAAAIPADAHNSLLYPEKPSAAVGETVEVVASISEPLGVADLPFYDNAKIEYGFGPLKMAAFEGDNAVDMEIAYYDIRNGARKRLTYEEVEAAYAELKKAAPDEPAYSVMSRVFNSDIGAHKISSEGTVSFAAASSYGTESMVKSFMKTFVNLTADGASTKARASHFAFDGIELRPVDDLGAAKPGGTVRVEALLNGKPQSGVVVYSGYKDLDEAGRVSPISGYSEKDNPIQHAGITDINGVVELRLPDVPDGASELRDVYLFTDGDLTVEKVRYRATISFTLRKQ